MVKAIIFDMDGTITLTEQFHIEALTELFRQQGLSYDPVEHMQKFAGAGTKVIIKTLFERSGQQISDDKIAELVLIKRDLYTKIVHERNIPFVKGVHEFIERIEKRGLKKIIATGNGDIEAVRYILSKIQLDSHFPEILSITEVPHGKPFPDVFLKAAERMGVLPSECVVLEDSSNGVQAAVAAHMPVIAFETTTKKSDLVIAGATYILPDYTFISDAMIA